MSENKFKHRFLARIIFEATTPLAVGSGEKDIMTDALVATDINGLPYIPGTSIAGVLRHAIGDEKAKEFFGFQETRDEKHKRAKKENKKVPDLDNIDIGSQIIFTSAQMVGKDGKVIDGLQNIDFSDEFYSQFKTLPIRQHCRIDSKGTAADGGKFDEQVVYKGTRFCFEVEMVSEGSNFSQFEDVLKELYSKSFRIGGGTRSGFGEVEVVSCQTAKIDFNIEDQLSAYLDKSSDLSDNSFWKKGFVETFDKPEENNTEKFTKYELKLKPDDFFLFGSGLGNEKADATPVTETFIDWKSESPMFVEQCVLIPASSVKGAISHRVAFHYNKLNNVFADTINKPEEHVGSKNLAVRTLFGSEGEKEKDNGELKNQQRGKVIISDIIEKKNVKRKLLNHVAIDRFTGGTIDGALYSEEVMYGKGQEYNFTLLVANDALEEGNVKEALENTLKDICNGMLPLGGGVNRGHGAFTGEVLINGKPL